MNLEAWNKAERRRADKFLEIKKFLSDALGPSVDLDEEAQNAIDSWEECVEIQEIPPKPKGPLQKLLREYHDFCVVIWSLEDEDKLGVEDRENIEALDRAQILAAGINSQIEELLTGTRSGSARDYVLQHLFASLNFGNPELLSWLDRQCGPGSARLSAALRDWIANPKYQ